MCEVTSAVVGVLLFLQLICHHSQFQKKDVFMCGLNNPTLTDVLFLTTVYHERIQQMCEPQGNSLVIIPGYRSSLLGWNK